MTGMYSLKKKKRELTNKVISNNAKINVIAMTDGKKNVLMTKKDRLFFLDGYLILPFVICLC